MILALRTDKPNAELYLYKDPQTLIDSIQWHAHRELSDTLLQKIQDILTKNDSDLDDLTGICVYQGPGSFTGLRIGITVANTLAYSLTIPIVAAPDEDWLAHSLRQITTQSKPQTIIPEYGSEAHITKPRK